MSSDFYRMGMSLYTAFTAKKAVATSAVWNICYWLIWGL